MTIAMIVMMMVMMGAMLAGGIWTYLRRRKRNHDR
jgi:LPXTG-motif cell wall-anchored protein